MIAKEALLSAPELDPGVLNDVDALTDALDLFDADEAALFFDHLMAFVATQLGMISAADEDNEEDGGGMLVDGNNDAGCMDAIAGLRKVAALLLKLATASSPHATHPHAAPIVELLHELLMPLDDAFPGAVALKTVVSRLCEKWWVHQLAGAENVITQLVPYLLVTALGPASHDADAKRLYNIRGALLLFDFEDESIESIRSLILRSFLHPAFLKVTEGRRFLSFIFTIHPGTIGLGARGEARGRRAVQGVLISPTASPSPQLQSSRR